MALQKPASKLKSIIAQIIRIATLKKYLYAQCLYTAQCEWVCFSGGDFAHPVMSLLREWHQMCGHACPETAAS